jgi:ABC-type transport system substrate-binding protein
MRPATEFARSGAELQMFPGFGRDAEKNRAEAKRLLAEAGYPHGFETVLKNRNVRVPYIDFGVFAIQEWRKIGVEAEHRPLETAAWYADGRDQGNFDVIVSGIFGYSYYIPGLWWRRSVVHCAKVRNHVAPPNHYSNQKLQDVWLAED